MTSTATSNTNRSPHSTDAFHPETAVAITVGLRAQDLRSTITECAR